MEEGHEGLTQFLMNEVTKLQQQSKVKTIERAELSRKYCTLEDKQKKLQLANQELQTFQQSKNTRYYFKICSDHNMQTAAPPHMLGLPCSVHHSWVYKVANHVVYQVYS